MEKQKAKIGDRIIVTNTFNVGDFLNGDLHTVIGLWDDRVTVGNKDFYGVAVDKYDEMGDMHLFEEEYEVYKENK